jgi:hypothetical protein
VILTGDGADEVFAETGRAKLGPGSDVGVGTSIAGGRGDHLIGGKGGDRIAAGPGDDLVHAAGGRRDEIACGPGVDCANLDRSDHAFGCELVLYP